MIRALALLFLLTSPALATQDGWPALYDVAGVAANDVLNIRLEPSASAEIIGTIAPGRSDIEVIRSNDEQTWGMINSGERSGWVSLTYMARQPGQWDGAYPEFTSCGGTEPFWSITRAAGVIGFRGLDLDGQTSAIDWETGTLNHRGRHSFRAGNMVGVLSNESCDDGMSDRKFGWEINLILLGAQSHYQGCCSLQPPGE